MAPTAAPGYADSFATARPAGAGQAPSAAPGYADSFATAKQAPRSMVGLGFMVLWDFACLSPSLHNETKCTGHRAAVQTAPQ